MIDKNTPAINNPMYCKHLTRFFSEISLKCYELLTWKHFLVESSFFFYNKYLDLRRLSHRTLSMNFFFLSLRTMVRRWIESRNDILSYQPRCNQVQVKSRSRFHRDDQVLKVYIFLNFMWNSINCERENRKKIIKNL